MNKKKTSYYKLGHSVFDAREHWAHTQDARDMMS